LLNGSCGWRYSVYNRIVPLVGYGAGIEGRAGGGTLGSTNPLLEKRNLPSRGPGKGEQAG